MLLDKESDEEKLDNETILNILSSCKHEELEDLPLEIRRFIWHKKFCKKCLLVQTEIID